MIQLSQKERFLLEDLKNQEEICVAKYKYYSEQTQDTQLKQLLSSISTEEQHHYDMVNQMLQGQEPNMSHPQQPQQGQQQQSQQQQGQQQQGQQQQGQQQQGGMFAQGSANDKIRCNDLLSTEKYVSGAYDTTIFEAVNPTVRQALQHIQKDEQQHGEKVFQYMQSHGMYQVH
ncbi:MAG: spore coat protein [Christensenellales bacterium]